MQRIVIIALSVFLLGISTSSQAEEPAKKIKPVMVLEGRDSVVTKIGYERCCSQEELRKIWAKHQGSDNPLDTPPCPVVDFDSYLIIVVFDGIDKEGSSVWIHEIVDDMDCVRIRLFSRGKQTGVIDGVEGDSEVKVESEADKLKKITRSYAFVVLPLVKKAIVIEEDTGRNSGVPIGWQEKKRFTAINRK